MAHTPDELAQASRRAAAFLAHYAARDGAGMVQALDELGAPLHPDVQRFIYALASLGTGTGTRQLGTQTFIDDMRAVALARAVDVAGPADGMPPTPTNPGGTT